MSGVNTLDPPRLQVQSHRPPKFVPEAAAEERVVSGLSAASGSTRRTIRVQSEVTESGKNQEKGCDLHPESQEIFSLKCLRVIL